MIVIPASLRSDFIHMAGMTIHIALESTIHIVGIRILDAADDEKPSFDKYADGWLTDYARIECKTSTADGYEGVLDQYLRPRLAKEATH